MTVYPQDWTPYLGVLLVFLRWIAILMIVPGLSHPAIPTSIKVLFAFTVALALFPLVREALGPVPLTLAGLGAAALRETAVGLLMGFAAYITFEGINLAAHFVGYQLGFNTVSLIDPQNQASVSAFVPLHSWLALMIFFLGDLHHQFLQLFAASFEATRQLTIASLASEGVFKVLIGLVGRLFTIAVQMAAPFTFLSLSVNAAVGALARTLPQMNVMLFSFPVTLLLGFAALYVVAPDLMGFIEGTLGQVAGDVMALLSRV